MGLLSSGNPKGSGMMKGDLLVPVGSLPMEELPTQLNVLSPGEQLIDPVHAQVEQPAFAHPGDRASSSGGRMS